MTVRCLVIGAGKMGSAHLQALAAFELNSLAAWAPSERRRDTVESVGARFFHGALDAALDAFQPTHVIVASPVETLAPISLKLISAGVRNLLVEKPVALSVVEGALLEAAVKVSGAQLYVGYNRRFYSSIQTALRLIADAGEEIESVSFEFNEVVSNSAGPLGHTPSVRERWLLANSLHVVDSALFPVGYPDPALSSFIRVGELAWHPAGSIFVGSGLTVRGIPFSYNANWAAPGRWGFEWATKSARFQFRPLERLSMLRPGSFEWEVVPLVDDLDERFKPGVYLQDRAFISCAGERQRLATLDQALELLYLGNRMAAYW